jgi:hypothetical protein
MSQQGVFGDLFCHLPLRHLCFWCRQLSKSAGSQALMSGYIGLDQMGVPARASFFGGDDPHGGVLVIRRVVLALLAAALLISSPSAWAQISLVQVTSCGQQAFPSTCTIPATGNGHLIVVGWQSAGGSNPAGTISSVTDNAGDTFVEAGAARSVDSAENDWNDIWYAMNSTAGATSVVITPSTSVTSAAVVIWEFSGVASTAALDQTATLNSQAATATPAGASVTITAPNEVIISLVDEENSMTGIVSGNPFVSDSSLFTNGWAHYITSSTGTYFAQWNQSPSGTYGSSTVSFLAAGSYSACDLNQDGTVNILDVELATDMALAPPPCTAPFGQCNPAFAEAVLTSAMGGACILPVLGAAPSSINFGNVPVGSSNTQIVTLTGTGTASTTISQAIVSGAGFSIGGLSFPLLLPVGQSYPLNVTFTPATAGSASGNIAFISNALDTPVNVILSGTGVTPVSHSVSLSWTPSTSSNVASYNIYRILSSSSTAPPTPYPSLGSISAATCSPTVCTYTDTSVQAGQSYWYYATAVNTGGSNSVPSNIVQAVVPTT